MLPLLASPFIGSTWYASESMRANATVYLSDKWRLRGAPCSSMWRPVAGDRIRLETTARSIGALMPTSEQPTDFSAADSDVGSLYQGCLALL